MAQQYVNPATKPPISTPTGTEIIPVYQSGAWRTSSWDTLKEWVLLGIGNNPGSGLSIIQQPSAPSDPELGMLWIDTDEIASSIVTLKTLNGTTLSGIGNIPVKTINGVSIFGTGNIQVSASGSITLNTDGTFANPSDEIISSQKAIKTYVDTTAGAVTKTSIGLSNVTNDAQLKSSQLSVDDTFADNSDTLIPSQKAVKAYVANHTSSGALTDAPSNGSLYGRKDATWTAITLTKGDQGDIGPAGPAGAKGDTGLQGLQGPKGDPGDQGPIGETGASGIIWKGTWSDSVDYTNNDAVYYDQSSWFASGDPTVGEIPSLVATHWFPLALHGATGSTGPKGDTGDKGDKGDPGDAGTDATILYSETPPLTPVNGEVWIDKSALPVTIPAGGTTGQVLAKINNTDYNTQWADQTSGTGNSTPIDHSSFIEDRLLAVGETAYIEYTSDTVVPLKIQTVEGYYEMSILGDSTEAMGADGLFTLVPNSGGLTAGSVDNMLFYTNSSIGDPSGTKSLGSYLTDSDKFRLASCRIIQSTSKINTKTKSKSIITNSISMYLADAYEPELIFSNWVDTTTAWTSLGTLVLPFAQSGKVIVRRII